MRDVLGLWDIIGFVPPTVYRLEVVVAHDVKTELASIGMSLMGIIQWNKHEVDPHSCTGTIMRSYW